MSKKIILDDKYVLGGGLGSWAKSEEYYNVKQGEMRCIGGIAMYAYTVYSRWFKYHEVNWCPVDQKLCHDFEAQKKWIASL